MRDDTALARYRFALALITALVAASATCWAVLTPAFRAPDEVQHLNSTLRLAYGGGWPAPGEALVSPGVDAARDEAALDTDVPGRYLDRDDKDQYVDVPPTPDDERTIVGPGNALADIVAPGTDTSTWDVEEIDQMTQHPPLYYAVAAGWLHLTGLVEARWDHQVLALRLLDVLLFTPVPLLAAGAARLVTGSRAAALVAASFPLLLPQIGHIMGSVTNDALVVLTGAAAAYLCARVVSGDPRRRTALILGVVVGVGLLTKVMAAFTVPVVVVAYLLTVSGQGRGRRAWLMLLALGVAFALGGWWWLRNLMEFGAVQPVGIPERFEPVEDRGPWYFVSTTVRHLTWSFFGSFGLLDVRVPDGVYWTGAIVLAALCVVALLRVPGRRTLAVLLLQAALLWCAVVANAWPRFAETGWVVAVQGRYMFGAIVGLMAGAAAGLWVLTTVRRSTEGRWTLTDLRRAGAAAGARTVRADGVRRDAQVPLDDPGSADGAGRGGAWLVPLVVMGGTAVSAAAMLFALRGFYRGPGENLGAALERWAGWSPLDGPQLAAWFVVAALVAAATVVAGVRYARSVSTVAPTADTTARTPTAAAGTTGSE
ncbi:DUF2142 domain-containing protein [Myceligenerans pegani]|uniref:DUF2142 domain-containing protein n=1 Tax=Myceligenerans pegani TaxID=2776917 RepID=A0ABR9MYD1_9MICO|nr:DUF2142 domain-containing protein [Myceligenerans sp. TRM 65318]MBE1876388.1 DUF2142 domain-containing protein [Myceligenerans sp. TRM 65318]MBE3018659.1 DUF2142 domain-containing protein [Myceligenerans sp. TRM 65318]